MLFQLCLIIWFLRIELISMNFDPRGSLDALGILHVSDIPSDLPGMPGFLLFGIRCNGTNRLTPKLQNKFRINTE